MKNTITKNLDRVMRRFSKPIAGELGISSEGRLDNEVVAQKTLMQQYRLLALQGKEHLPDLRDAGFRKYSQFEEDGILLYLFSLIRPVNRTCVEICAGIGRECNTANLIINHGWWGHLFDGDPSHVARGRQFFAEHKDTSLHPPRFSQAWITAENVNALIAESGVSGPVDLLSLDIDGMDYWVWKAISVIDPQVVVCEISNLIPADRALTVPYDAEFVCQDEEYRSVSLAAMVKLGREKGYRMVGTHRFGFNAFFVKKGVGEDFFPEVEPASCLQDPFTQLARKERWPKVKDRKWQEV